MPEALKQPLDSTEAGSVPAQSGAPVEFSRSGVASTDLTSVYASWLSWASQMIAGVQSSVLVEIDHDHLSTPIFWPEEPKNPTEIMSAVREVLKTKDCVTHSRVAIRESPVPLCDVIAIPVVTRASSCIVAVQLNPRSRDQQQSVVQLLKWVALWLDTLSELGHSSVDDIQGPDSSLLSRMLAHRTLHSASVELVNMLADRFDCERVSIGIRRRLLVRLLAISQTVDFDARKQLIRHIEAAMEESLDQEQVVTLPHGEGIVPKVVHAHEELLNSQGSKAVCTLPIEIDETCRGAVTLERDSSKPFSEETVSQIASIVLGVRPVLALMYQLDQPLHRRITGCIREKISAFKESSTKQRRVWLFGMALAGLLICAIPVDHKVVATAVVEGADQQQLVAPETGFVKAAYASAGDRVTKGQIIASFEDTALVVEREKWQNELEKMETGYIQALTNKDRVELGVMQSRKRQAQAELKLIEQRLSRGELRAPFDGVVVNGDLSQALGSPVTAGQLLFEIASLNDFRLILEIDEHDISGIETGQSGTLRISALPGQTYETTLLSAIPVATISDRRSVFRMEASIESNELLRPGMQGYAKVTLGKRSLIKNLTAGLGDRISLWLWKLGWVR